MMAEESILAFFVNSILSTQQILGSDAKEGWNFYY